MKNIFTLLCLLAAIQVQAQNYWQKVASGTQKHLYNVSLGSQQVTPDYRKEHGIVLPGCAPGVYFVQLTTGSGLVMYKQLVVK